MRTTGKSSASLLSLAVAAGLAGVAPRGLAQLVQSTWVAPNTGNWSNPANWSGGVVPSSGSNSMLIFDDRKAASFTTINDLGDPFPLFAMRAYNGTNSTPTIGGGALQMVANGTNVPYLDFYNNSTIGLSSSIIFNNNVVLGAPVGELGAAGGGGSPTLVQVNGAISGAGQLLIGGEGLVLNNAANTYGGGTDVVTGRVTVGPNGSLGTGHVVVHPYFLGQDSSLVIPAASNVLSGDRSILVMPGATVTFNNLDQAAINRMDPASRGVLSFGTSTTHIAGALDLSQYPGLRIGASVPTNVASLTFSADVTPNANTYRFGGQDQLTVRPEVAPLFIIASHLTDAPDGTPRSLNLGDNAAYNGGGQISVSNTSNSYTGGTLIQRGAYAAAVPTALRLDYTPAAGQTPLGTGPLVVQGSLRFEGKNGAWGSLPNAVSFGPGSQLVFDNVHWNSASNYSNTDGNADRWPDAKPLPLNGTQLVMETFAETLTEKVGATTFDGRSVVYFNDVSPGSFGGSTATVEVNSLMRVNHGTLQLTLPSAYTSQLGASYRLKADATGAGMVDPATGLVAPYVVNGTTGYLKLDANGVFQAATARSGFDPSGRSDLVSTSNGVFSDQSCWGLIVNSSAGLTISAGKTVTLRGGGLMFDGVYGNGASVTGGTLRFGTDDGTPVEALINVPANGTIGSPISAASLTKFGAGNLTLTGANTFTGGLYVNEGTLTVGGVSALPAGNALCVEFGATFVPNGYSATVSSLTGAGFVSNSGSVAATLTVNNADNETFEGVIRDRTSIGGTLSLVKTGPGTLTLAGVNDQYGSDPVNGSPNYLGGYAGLTTVAQGTLNLNERSLRYGSYATVAGATLNVNIDHPIGSLSGSGTTAVAQGVTLTADAISQGRLSVGGRAIIRAGNAGASNAIDQIDLAATGSLDLNDNRLTTATPASALRQYLAAGYQGGLWNGTAGAVLSSTAAAAAGGPANRSLGYVTAGVDPLPPLVTLGTGQTLVESTVPGDADLSGSVDFNDFLSLQNAYGSSGDWAQGDFNYDGVVNYADFVIFRDNYGRSLTSNAVLPFTLEVPEPAAGACIGGVAAASLVRRRRRRVTRVAPRR